MRRFARYCFDADTVLSAMVALTAAVIAWAMAIAV